MPRLHPRLQHLHRSSWAFQHKLLWMRSSNRGSSSHRSSHHSSHHKQLWMRSSHRGSNSRSSLWRDHSNKHKNHHSNRAQKPEG